MRFGDDIPAGLVPISLSETTFTVKIPEQPSICVLQSQMALAPAYTFTDYKSQGQTLDVVIVDLAQPPDQGSRITPFSAYVALSRSRRQENVHILWPFDESLFTTPPSAELEAEDGCLAGLDRATQLEYLHL
ncbi:hypothetical protein D9756_011173 [Leucocoprinus leucothites]|uniref:Uncharacterized protein n=1 Tax=Leucocoprinus leucothites TaxID=201217 RepID=A0A8H5CNN7_9AGAR|nr:hypothetical protein D9756_011173 [Leucoagaricus leucothites]